MTYAVEAQIQSESSSRPKDTISDQRAVWGLVSESLYTSRALTRFCVEYKSVAVEKDAHMPEFIHTPYLAWNIHPLWPCLAVPLVRMVRPNQRDGTARQVVEAQLDHVKWDS